MRPRCTAYTLGVLAAAFALATAARAEAGVACFPANHAIRVNPDTHLVLTFSSPPTLGKSGQIRIYDAAGPPSGGHTRPQYPRRSRPLPAHRRPARNGDGSGPLRPHLAHDDNAGRENRRPPICTITSSRPSAVWPTFTSTPSSSMATWPRFTPTITSCGTTINTSCR